MKKTILFILILCATIGNAMKMNHFNINVNKAISEDSLISYISERFAMPNNTSLEQAKVINDNNGGVHSRYDQYIGGILVEGGQILVHTKNGIVQNINGVLLEVESSSLPILNRIVSKSKISQDAENIVVIPTNNETKFRYAYKIKSEQLSSYVYIDTENGDTLDVVPFMYDAQTNMMTNTIYYGRQQLTVNATGTQRYFSKQNPRIETILSTKQDFSHATGGFINNQIQLCNTYHEQESDSLNSYIVSITFNLKDKSQDWWSDIEEGIGSPDLYIKIINNSGTVVYQSETLNDWKSYTATFNPMFHLDGQRYTIYLYDEDLVSDDNAGGFTISSTTKGIGTLSTTNYDVTISITGNPLRDAHWGMEKTLEYFGNIHNLNSYDGNGAEIYQFVNPIDTFNGLPRNAYARYEYPYCLAYGLGDGINDNPWVALDVIAHEFTHLVTLYSTIAGLEYKGESGALNEGFSDIFAILVEGYTFGSYDWTFGEKVKLKYPYARSLNNPKSGEYEQPNTYGKGPWVDPTNTSKEKDYGGVHINNTILSHMFYLLCNGGSGINDNQQSYNVQGIGITKATEIVYNTWMYRLAYRSTFADARQSFVDEVTQNSKYGINSPEHKAVMNAWYAVGVGDKYVDPSEDFELKPGKYVIVASRAKEGDRNWYYMTSDLGTASTKRFQAVSTETESIDAIDITDLEDKFVWTLEADGSNWKLKNGTQYVTWTSGNSANLGTTAKIMTLDVADNQVLAHFNDGTAERYLSFNATTNNNYFAFYSGTNQVEQLFFLPYDEGITPPVESNRYIVLAQRNATSNWFYMTSDLGSASTKRYQAVDAGTSVLADVVNQNLAYKYYWEIDGNKLHTVAGYSTWTSGNSANFDATGKDLTIQQQTDGTYTFSFIEGDNTRYLALNKTAGNDYFAYYIDTNQIYKLTLVKEGSSGTTTSIEGVIPAEQKATKILRDGQIYILRDGKVYDLTGRKL